MTRYTSPTLRDWRLPMVRLACDRCERKGQYRYDTLIARYGPDVTMPDRRHLIAECPQRHAPGDACGVYYADLKGTAGSPITSSPSPSGFHPDSASRR
jgi:hypothetical protein